MSAYFCGTVQWRISGDEVTARRELTGVALRLLHVARNAKDIGKFVHYDTGWHEYPQGKVRVISQRGIDTVYMEAVGGEGKRKKYIVPSLYPAYRVYDNNEPDSDKAYQVIVARWRDLSPWIALTDQADWEYMPEVDYITNNLPSYPTVTYIPGSAVYERCSGCNDCDPKISDSYCLCSTCQHPGTWLNEDYIMKVSLDVNSTPVQEEIKHISEANHCTVSCIHKPEMEGVCDIIQWIMPQTLYGTQDWDGPAHYRTTTGSRPYWPSFIKWHSYKESPSGNIFSAYEWQDWEFHYITDWYKELDMWSPWDISYWNQHGYYDRRHIAQGTTKRNIGDGNSYIDQTAWDAVLTNRYVWNRPCNDAGCTCSEYEITDEFTGDWTGNYVSYQTRGGYIFYKRNVPKSEMMPEKNKEVVMWCGIESHIDHAVETFTTYQWMGAFYVDSVRYGYLKWRGDNPKTVETTFELDSNGMHWFRYRDGSNEIESVTELSRWQDLHYPVLVRLSDSVIKSKLYPHIDPNLITVTYESEATNEEEAL